MIYMCICVIYTCIFDFVYVYRCVCVDAIEQYYFFVSHFLNELGAGYSARVDSYQATEFSCRCFPSPGITAKLPDYIYMKTRDETWILKVV